MIPLPCLRFLHSWLSLGLCRPCHSLVFLWTRLKDQGLPVHSLHFQTHNHPGICLDNNLYKMLILKYILFSGKFITPSKLEDCCNL